MKIKITQAIISTVVVTASISAAAQREQSSALEEIIVTAQKRAESAQSVGMSITAVSGDALVERGVLSTTDLANVIPGFTYVKAPRGTPIYSLRGVGFDDNSLGSAPTVATYLDESPMHYPVMTRFTTFDLERVEVLKGPQGILFGQNSTGGAINFIAAKPTEQTEAGVVVSYGNYETADVRGYVSGSLTDELRVRASGMWINASKGWQKSYTHGGDLGEQDVLSGRFIAEWTPTADLSVGLTLQGWRDKSDTQAAQLLEVKPSIPDGIPPEYDSYPRAPDNAKAADWDAHPEADPLGIVGNRPFERNDDFLQGSLRIDYSLMDSVVLTSITSMADYNQDFYQDTDGSALRTFHLQNEGSIKSFSQEVRLTGTTDTVDWIVGANYSEDETSDRTGYDFPVSSVNTAFLGIFESFGTADQDIKNYAAFGNVAWSVTDTVKVNFGARYSKDERDYSGCTADSGSGDMAFAFSAVLGLLGTEDEIQPGGCTTSSMGVPGLVQRSLKEDNISWRMGVDWQLDPDLLVYTNASRGFKSGSIPAVNTASAFQIQPVSSARFERKPA